MSTGYSASRLATPPVVHHNHRESGELNYHQYDGRGGPPRSFQDPIGRPPRPSCPLPKTPRESAAEPAQAITRRAAAVHHAGAVGSSTAGLNAREDVTNRSLCAAGRDTDRDYVGIGVSARSMTSSRCLAWPTNQPATTGPNRPSRTLPTITASVNIAAVGVMATTL